MTRPSFQNQYLVESQPFRDLATRDHRRGLTLSGSRRDRLLNGPSLQLGAQRLLCSTPMAEERTRRRLAAILAADVVGYSRLMEQDEAGTLAALKSRRKQVLEPLVAKHQGRVFKVTGD